MCCPRSSVFDPPQGGGNDDAGAEGFKIFIGNRLIRKNSMQDGLNFYAFRLRLLGHGYTPLLAWDFDDKESASILGSKFAIIFRLPFWRLLQRGRSEYLTLLSRPRISIYHLI